MQRPCRLPLTTMIPSLLRVQKNKNRGAGRLFASTRFNMIFQLTFLYLRFLFNVFSVSVALFVVHTTSSLCFKHLILLLQGFYCNLKMIIWHTCIRFCLFRVLRVFLSILGGKTETKKLWRQKYFRIILYASFYLFAIMWRHKFMVIHCT